MKKKVIISAIAFSAVLLVIVSVLLPVDFDAITGSEDFKRNISELYIVDLDTLVRSELGEAYEVSSTIEDIAKTIQWDGRTITCNAFFIVHGEVMSDVVRIHFKGKRYWYKAYRWQIVD